MGDEDIKEFKVLHLFAGIGGGSLGFQQAVGEWKGLKGKFRTLAGIDVDPKACEDYEYITESKAVCMDLFERRDFIDFHGHEPSQEWKESTPDDIMTAAGGEYPDVIFLSPPCKGFSGLLPKASADTAKYQALNRLVTRGIFLTLEAFRDDLPSVFLLENVPRIRTRGQSLLNTIKGMLQSYGYVVDDRDHDCGEIGGLAQHRKRYLLIARNKAKMDSFIYQPTKQRVKSIGEVIGPLPLPGAESMGPLHRLPKLQWKTWVRLALIPAGGDWRDLEKIAPEEYRLEHIPRGGGSFGVQEWDEPSHTVTGRAKANGSTASNIADPRLNPKSPKFNHAYKVSDWNEPSGVISSGTGPSCGGLNITDPRLTEREGRHPGVYRVVKFDEPSPCVTGTRFGSGAPAISDPRTGFKDSTHTAIYQVNKWEKEASTVTGAHRPNNGAICIADPRVGGGYSNKRKVLDWKEPSSTVTGTPDIQSGAQSVADPRLGCKPRSGMMGVQKWDDPGKTVIGAGDVHSGAAAIADPRIPGDKETLDPPPIIISLDGTWHRPLTTLELAALQGLPVIINGKPLRLSGNSDQRWREAIGNMVPPPAGRAMAEVVLHALLVASENSWEMSANDIWVSPKSWEEIRVNLDA